MYNLKAVVYWAWSRDCTLNEGRRSERRRAAVRPTDPADARRHRPGRLHDPSSDDEFNGRIARKTKEPQDGRDRGRRSDEGDQVSVIAQHHQTGPVVSIVTSFPGTRWLDVEICVSNDVSQSSTEQVADDSSVAAGERKTKGTTGDKGRTDIPFQTCRRDLSAGQTKRKDSTGRSQRCVVNFDLVLALRPQTQGNKSDGFLQAAELRRAGRRTVSRHHATSSSLTTQILSRCLRCLCRYDSVWTV